MRIARECGCEDHVEGRLGQAVRQLDRGQRWAVERALDLNGPIAVQHISLDDARP